MKERDNDDRRYRGKAMKSHKILNFCLNNLSDQELNQTLSYWLNGSESKIIVTPNPEILLLARRDKFFAELLNRADLSLPDGFGLKLAALIGGFSLRRHTGTDTLERLARLAEDKPILLLGSSESAMATAKIFKQRYSNLKIQTLDPGQLPESGEVEEKIIFEIQKYAPAILAVGLGQGKQERFIDKYLHKLPSVRITIGVGGAFDMISGHLPRAPRFMRKIGLEWLWRLIIEPKRWRRIANAVLIFPIVVIYDKIKGRKFMKIRTRFAPSPTGYLHIGGLRTVLYNYLFAKKHGGTLILRIEDTDRARFVPGATESLVNTLRIMGLEADEGPTLNGNVGEYGPYIQSERTAIYQEHARTLLEKGSAYYCFCSEERLTAKRKEQELAKLPTRYDRTCLNLTPEEIETKLAAGEKFVVRMRVPEGVTEFDDLARGHIKFANTEIDDQVLLKSDGFPTYHLANVVDDHMMEISHVIRGDEWLPSAPKHVILYRAFGWNTPFFAHLPLILNPDKSKLSKRQGDVAVEDYLKKGYLPNALNNFVALLGFNPKADQEIYSMAELIELFDLEKVNKAAAVFDIEKLKWMNSQYIHKLSVDELTTLCVPYLIKAGKTVPTEFLAKICAVERERVVLLSDIVEKIDSYQKLPDYAAELLVWKKSNKDETLEQLKKIVPFIETLDLSSVELIEVAIRKYIVSNNLSNGIVLWPLRAALSGSAASPSPFELIWVLGREEGLARLNHAIKLLHA